MLFATLRFQDEAVKLEEDNGNDTGMARLRCWLTGFAMVY